MMTSDGEKSKTCLEPVRERHATLVDLLDRALDKGVVLHADIIVSVAGIPLIGVTLRAAIAGMETMLKYGIMEAWDESIRSWETNQRRLKQRNFMKDGQVILNVPGAHFYEKGIYAAWRYGNYYLTDEALYLYHKTYDEVLMKVDLSRIRGMAVKTEKSFAKGSCAVLYMVLDNNEVRRLRSLDIHSLKDTITAIAAGKGAFIDDEIAIPEYEDFIISTLVEGEQVTHRGKLWHLCEQSGPGSILNITWRPGKLYLTNRRLCWWYQTESKVMLDIPIESICACYEDGGRQHLLKQDSPVLDLVYKEDTSKRVASFSGEGVDGWQEAVQSVVSENGNQPEQEKESCPKCGKLSDIEQLLDKGCPHCDWLSARIQRKALGIPV